MLSQDFTTGNDLFIPSLAYKITLPSSPAQLFRYTQYMGQDVRRPAAAPYLLELETKVTEDYPKFYNHKEGPY